MMEKYFKFIEKKRETIRKTKNSALGSKEEIEELEKNNLEFKEYREVSRENESKNIENIRNVIKNYRRWC